MKVRKLIALLGDMPPDADVKVNCIEAVQPGEAPLDRSHDNERVAQGFVESVDMIDDVCWLEAEG